MARNQNCNCLCHGSDGNYIGDVYFSCKNCYSANHMEALPRRQATVKASPRPNKISKAAPAPAVHLPDAVVNAVIKIAASGIMNALADAAEEARKS